MSDYRGVRRVRVGAYRVIARMGKSVLIGVVVVVVMEVMGVMPLGTHSSRNSGPLAIVSRRRMVARAFFVSGRCSGGARHNRSPHVAAERGGVARLFLPCDVGEGGRETIGKGCVGRGLVRE